MEWAAAVADFARSHPAAGLAGIIFAHRSRLNWRHSVPKQGRSDCERLACVPPAACVRSEAIYREEMWEVRTGRVVKYNLAFNHREACQHDQGRLVGYDNAAGYHDRHFMSEAHAVFISYEQTLKRF